METGNAWLRQNALRLSRIGGELLALLVALCWLLWGSPKGMVLCAALAAVFVLGGLTYTRKRNAGEDVVTRNLHAATALTNLIGAGVIFYMADTEPYYNGVGWWFIVVVLLGAAGIMQLSYAMYGPAYFEMESRFFRLREKDDR